MIVKLRNILTAVCHSEWLEVIVFDVLVDFLLCDSHEIKCSYYSTNMKVIVIWYLNKLHILTIIVY